MHIEINNIFQHKKDIETKRPPALDKDPNIRFREEQDAILLINQVDRNIYRLNRTAGDIFLLCDGHNATQDIVDEITRKYEGDSHHIKDAVIKILEDLIGKGMVHIIEKPGEPEGAAFLHREGTSDSYKLNTTMTFIWNQIDGTKSVGKTIDIVRDTYEIPHEKAESAVKNALEYFISENLVERVDI